MLIKLNLFRKFWCKKIKEKTSFSIFHDQEDISTDIPRRVPFGITMEYVVRRICDDITRMWCWLHLRITNNEPVTNDVSAQIINGERLNDQNKITRHQRMIHNSTTMIISKIVSYCF